MEDVMNEEKDIRQDSKLSQAFGSNLEYICLCMTLVEEGRAVSFWGSAGSLRIRVYEFFNIRLTQMQIT